MDDWVNLTVPKGNERELCSHAEMGFIPWGDGRRVGPAVLTGAVPPHLAPYLCRAGFGRRAMSCNRAQPPQGPIRCQCGAFAVLTEFGRCLRCRERPVYEASFAYVSKPLIPREQAGRSNPRA